MFSRTIDPVPIYGHCIIFLVGDGPQKFKEYLKENFDVDVEVQEDARGYAWKLNYSLQGCVYFIWLSKYANLIEDHCHLSHEISHHVFRVMYDLGMERTFESDEAYAYYDQWLTGELLQFLNEYRDEQAEEAEREEEEREEEEQERFFKRLYKKMRRFFAKKDSR